MFARYLSPHRIALTFAAFLAGSLSLRAQAVDQTVTGILTVNGNTILEGTLGVGGDTDIFGNTLSLGNSLTDPNIAGLEIYIKNINTTPETRFIDQVTTLDGTTFRWGMKSATSNDLGTEWMSLNSSTLELSGSLVVNNGTENKLMAQTLSGGVHSILTMGLADSRYLKLSNTAPLTISDTTAATSPGTGALVVAGGLSVLKDAYINGVRVGRGGSGTVTSNTAIGSGSLNANTSGSNNTATGLNSLNANTSGSYNTAYGVNSLRNNTTGYLNTAIGSESLYGNTTGILNNAIGAQSLYSNTTGTYNNATGAQSLYNNTTGSYNTANGGRSLNFNITGNFNTASGAQSLYSNTTGHENAAIGFAALIQNTTGNFNSASGSRALISNTTGNFNTANGAEALQSNTTGAGNVANGYQALYSNASADIPTGPGGYYDSNGNQYNSIMGGTYEPNGDYYYTMYDAGGYWDTTNTEYYYNDGFGNYVHNSYGYNYAGGGTYEPSGDYYYVTTYSGNYTPNYAYTYYYFVGESIYVDGNYNTASGYQALYSNITGDYNIALGFGAGVYQSDGVTPLTTPNNSIYLGSEARGYDDNDSNSIVIGHQAIGEGANTTVIGNSSTTSAHIYGQLNVSGLTVSGQSVLTQAQASSAYLTNSSAATTYLSKTTYDPNGDGKVDTAQITGVAPLAITNTTAATSSTTGALRISGGLGVINDAYINTVKVGLGGGNIASNTVLGNLALGINTTGHNNVAVGMQALYYNTTGGNNTANGCLALFNNSSGNGNTAMGDSALASNSTGNSNTVSGMAALHYNTTGSFNTASGDYVFHYNTTGSQNIALGVRAGMYQANGSTTLTTSNNSVYVGAYTRGFDNNDNNAIVIGYQAVGEGANTTVIGNAQTTSAHIYGELNVSSLKVDNQPVLTQTTAASTFLTPTQASDSYFNKTQADGRYMRGDGATLNFGTSSSAENAYSVAFGSNARARGDVASSTPSFAFGKGAAAGLSSTEAGITPTHSPGDWGGGYGALAIGESSYAGHYSVAMGLNAQARYIGVALGQNATSYGASSFAFGYNSKAIGGNSIAMGTWAGAAGDNSIAMGYATGAGAPGAIVLGFYSSASADHSMVMGRFLSAASPDSLVVGAYNIADAWDGVAQRDPDDGIFVVANGTAEAARSNAFVVKRNGDTEVKGDLKVEKNATVTGTTTLNGTATVKGQLIIEVPAGGIDMGEFDDLPQ